MQLERRDRRNPVRLLALLAALVAGAARGQVITEFPVPTAGSNPLGIITGADGNLWFTDFSTSKIGRITPAGVVTEFPLPANSLPQFVAAGADGNLWFTEIGTNKIGRMTTAGALDEFPVLTASSGLVGITDGPDGNLWFAEGSVGKIGRITTAGVVTEFPIPASGSAIRIAGGSDGNVWFTDFTNNKIGRITMAGVVTEFPVLTASSAPQGIAAGPDGNIWFTETDANRIGRITPSGVVTEFPTAISSGKPIGIAAGPDGNLWFTVFPAAANRIGRITPAGVVTDFPVPTAGSVPDGITGGPDGNVWFAEVTGNKIGRITTGPLTPQPMAVDAHAAAGTSSNVNGVLEPGETVQVAPAWENTLVGSQSFTATASKLTGPAGPVYTIDDATAGYGTVGAGLIADCNSATGDCYRMTISGARPAQHWDATFTESLSASSITRSWTVHIGNSFADVPTTHPFYAFIENLFHSGATGGCGAGNYCPSGTVTRAQMAVFLLKGKFGTNHVPPPATGLVFGDVHIGDFAADWIEELAGFQITGGCGGGNYCPGQPVTRAQMAVFLLKAEHGSAYTPPACVGIFTDVPCSSPFAIWVEQLAAEGITAGCGGGNYCPNDPNIRGQMAVFLVKIFGIPLYGA